MIRDLIFIEAARRQFDALTKQQRGSVLQALQMIIQDPNAHSGAWRPADDRHPTLTYVVHPSGAIVVKEITTSPARRAGVRQPYAGMEMRHEGGGRWIHMNPHEE